jgi:hypothetical protein
MNDGLERICKEAVLIYLKCYLGISLEGVKMFVLFQNNLYRIIYIIRELNWHYM